MGCAHNGVVQILVKAGADPNLANPEVSGVNIYPMIYAQFEGTCILSFLHLCPYACSGPPLYVLYYFAALIVYCIPYWKKISVCVVNNDCKLHPIPIWHVHHAAVTSFILRVA